TPPVRPPGRGYGNRLHRHILTFIPGSSPTQAPVAERPVALPPVVKREARHAITGQRIPRIRARVFALGRRDQIGKAPSSIAGNGQDLDSGRTGGRTRLGTDIRSPPSAAQNLAFLVSSLAGDFGPSCGEHLGRSCFTTFEAATTAETDGGCILTFQRWRFSILDLAARDLSTIHPQQGRLVRADHIFRDQRSRKNRSLRSWH